MQCTMKHDLNTVCRLLKTCNRTLGNDERSDSPRGTTDMQNRIDTWPSTEHGHLQNWRRRIRFFVMTSRTKADEEKRSFVTAGFTTKIL